MSVTMPRPAFTVVSSTVAALVVVGFASTIIRPMIPAPVGNELGKEGSEFLSRAAIQKIDWKKPTAETFSAARRRDLPILLFIGNGYHPLARGLDNGALLSPRVQSFLARNFECIRVDTIAYPEYRNAFLPIGRGALGFPTDCQLWVLDPSGKIVDLLPNIIALYPKDEALILNALVEAKDKFEQAISSTSPSKLEVAQEQDSRALLSPELPQSPPFSDYDSQLLSAIYEKGGFGKDGPRILTPEPWRLLLNSGRVEEFRKSFDPVLRSPIVDLLDGGFFHGSGDSDWMDVDFDKSATANAEMLLILSTATSILKDPIYKLLAERTFDSLVSDYTLTNGFAAGRGSDQQENNRSKRASFGVRKLKEALPDSKDLEFAQVGLGLRVESNPRMSPYPATFSIADDQERLDEVLAKLRKNTGPMPPRTAPGYTDVAAYCVARLLESSRVLGDSQRRENAERLFPWVENARERGEIIHGIGPIHHEGYLGDYLAFADAYLQYFLSTGRYESLLTGRAVLKEALDKFGGTQLGVLRMGLEKAAPFPTALSLPELADPGIESTVSYAIRLCSDYGRIFKDDTALRQFAGAATGLYGEAAGRLGIKGAGFFNSARRVFDDGFFVSVGPRAQEWSDLLASSSPARLSIPAFGEIRPDVRKLGAGVYLVRGESIRGPFTPEQAAKEVSPFLGLNL